MLMHGARFGEFTKALLLNRINVATFSSPIGIRVPPPLPARPILIICASDDCCMAVVGLNQRDVPMRKPAHQDFRQPRWRRLLVACGYRAGGQHRLRSDNTFVADFAGDCRRVPPHVGRRRGIS